MDDEEMDGLREAVREFRREMTRRAFADLTRDFEPAPPQMPCPSPGEWHPAYAGLPILFGWLNGVGEYADRGTLRIPTRLGVGPSSMTADETYPTEPLPQPMILTRRRCAGPAPYVGRPFCYMWWVATDDWGRAIAGDAHMRYLTPA